ncbi:uncharacterized protein LOC130734365 isoform X2 [Lotus japonicus]|uniref:uncharacterized protein LOC130734365 isoform X2 n=1 Tax=Lotus japonicus TaxID=34305 RepID=UPI00258FB1A1|nr:uncharacterized protein LOC130734365 isoform X2 [Lotus japonicus]
MDQHYPRDRHYHHHHQHQQQHPQQHRTRYAPLGPQSHHHLSQPPPPLPPPHAPPPPPHPPPLSYRNIHTPPPPPLYNTPPVHPSRQLQFYPHHRSAPEERPVPTNHPFSDDLLPRRNIPDYDRRNPEPAWNPSLDDLNYPPLDYDREFNHHRPQQPPPPPPSYPPVDSLRYDASDGANCRLRTERLDGNPREGGYAWGREGEGSGKYRRSVVEVPISRDADVDSKSSGGYSRDRVYDDSDVPTRVGRVENSRRWAMNERKVPREFHDSFELVNGEMKREYSEMGRYSNNSNNSSSNSRGGNSRERGSETFNRTPPKKQIQKKSALLRIQTVKPNNHRNRDVEQLRYAGYASPDSNSSYFRGKEQHNGYSGGGHGMRVEEREGSPVELDISFESNSLVAKAIVSAAPSAAPVPDLNVNATHVSDADLASVEKDKKVSVSDGDSGLQPGRVTTGAADLISLPCKQSDTSSAGKELNLHKNVPDTSSQPCTDVIGKPDGKNGVVVSVASANICRVKPSSRVVKKKKVVKRVVKKAVVNPNSTVSSSLPANAPNGTLKTDSVTLGSSTASGPDKTETFLEGRGTAFDKVSVPDCLYPLLNEENELNEDKKGDLSSLLSLGPDSRSHECKTEQHFDIGKVSRFERGGGISNSPSCASISEDKKSDSDCLDANNSAHDLHGMPNTDMVTISLSRSTSSEINYIDYDNKQLCQSEVSLSHGKYSNVGSPQNRNLVVVGDERDCKLFSSADSVISTDLIDAHKSANNRVYGFNSNDLTVSEEKNTISESGNYDTFGNVNCGNMAPTITKNASLTQNSDTAIPLQSSGMAACSNSGNTRIQDSLDCLQHASALKQGSDNGSSNLGDSITVHNFGIMKDDQKQMSPSDVTISPKNCDTEKTFRCSNTSVGSDEWDAHRIKMGKVTTHKFLNSKMEDMLPDRVNPHKNACDVDSSSSMLLKDPSLPQALDQSVQSLDLNLSSMDGVAILRGKRGVSETELYGGNYNDKDDVNKASPVSKRKKVADSPPKFTECQSEFSDAGFATTSNARVPISFRNNQTRQKEVALSSMSILSTAQTMPYSEHVANLSDSILARGPFESMDASRETMSSESPGLQHSDIVSSSPCADSAFPNAEFPVLECEQKEIINPIVPIGNNQTDILVIGEVKGEKADLQAVKGSYGFRDLVQRSPTADMESNDLNMNDDLLVQQNLMSYPADGGRVTTSNSNDDLIEDFPNATSDMFSKGMTSEVLDRKTQEFTETHKENSRGYKENPNSKSVVEHDSDLNTSLTQHTKENLKSDHAIGRDPIMKNIMPEPSKVYSKVTTQGLKTYCSELNGSKSQPGVTLKPFQGHSFTISKSKTKASASSAPISKPRTWHRFGNNPTTSLPRIKPSPGTAPPKRPILPRKANFQNTSTSYIRKGNNSLVRQPSPVSALPQISSANQSPARSESRADVTDQSIYMKTGETYAPQHRQRTPSLPIDNKPKENISSPLVDPPSSGLCENLSYPGKSIEANDAPKSSEDSLMHVETSENPTSSSNIGESQVEANDGNISSMNTRRIVYIKPKTNQLVATSNSCDIVSTDEKGQTACSDGYFKRSKNQLVRTTFENHINQTIATPNSNVNSDGREASKVLCNRRFIKRRSHKVSRSSGKPLKASFVWTLRGKNSSGNDGDSLHYHKVLPRLFPWKRTTYLRSFVHNSASSFDSSSVSAISKKLLLSRKRDTVYTRSTHGFSLWKSKVLGVGGYSLKWSKSIEKHSKKANEEATLAVAAVERKKREQKDEACINSQTKTVDCVGERIFRIGSVRYRMDPSRRTLQRISDDESPSSASVSSGLAGKRAYIPRRLVIGNDEYVRIGNGNKLIRDPKKRTRKLANEKVRWSLHTARQRLARKQKYCQFFTRFGKCNKDGGKCPYIHDPSKVAVCTKFLNGLCSTPNCKLTHKVIPERMPDCSYFLQGLCSNRNCPYRHVNVNPKASICEGFLKGYCADGNECRKKHSYICPAFEATGTCVQGTKCKLHHPKKQSKGKKRKRSGDQNSRGRYFGSISVDVSEPEMMMASSQQNLDLEKELSDYISLNVNEEVADVVDQSFEQSTFCGNDSMDLDTYDELKPVLAMTKLTSQAPQSSCLQALDN